MVHETHKIKNKKYDQMNIMKTNKKLTNQKELFEIV